MNFIARLKNYLLNYNMSMLYTKSPRTPQDKDTLKRMQDYRKKGWW